MGAAGAMDLVCDCHVHAFGPLDRYPAKAERGYDPPAARPDAYRTEAGSAGIGRCVFVQPSIYGDDNKALLDALAERDGRDRGIVTPSDGWTLKDLAGLHERGIRGLRLNLLSPGGNGPATIRRLAPAMKDLGWHVAALLDATQPGLLDDLLAHLGVPVVLDHFGRPPQGVVDPGLAAFAPLRRALAAGRIFVKLSAAYQISQEAPPWNDVAPLAVTLIETGPENVLFASNWPHVGGSGVPDLRHMIDVTAGWIGEAGVAPDLVFKRNPEALYA
jgi:predicted TIM-barrel fold metal-dependent hydrolase